MAPNTTPNTDTSKPRSAIEHVSGLIERITFQSGESGFCVLRVKVRGHQDLVTVVGTAPQVQAGEWSAAERESRQQHQNASILLETRCG